MRRNIYLLFLMCLLIPGFLDAQHQEVGDKPQAWKGSDSPVEDSTSVLHAFKSGSLEGHLRYFFSLTDNNSGLTDYFGNAAGGGIRFETARFHGFQFGVSGFFIFNVGSSDLTKKDSLTNQGNRYEIGLFDIEDPTNKKDIDRLEEFYLRYNIGKSYIRFGRQLINTPFINLQDGRMRPTGVEGIWFELNDLKKWNFEGGWIYAISPRSTVKWYETDESVGLYPSGVNALGVKSNYSGNLNSHGVFTMGTKWQPTRSITLKVWDLYFEDVMNSAMVQLDVRNSLNDNVALISAVQYVRQDAVNDGGNEDPLKSYIDKNAFANVFGGRLGIQKDKSTFLVNYTHITDHGRYLMPREWGRDPFFTFMPRERNEGFGNVHAFTASVARNFPIQRLKSTFTAGYFQLPDILDYRLNKYAMPSYMQFNADVRYSFSGMLKGLDAQFLFVAKMNRGDLHNDRRSEFNKVNMELYNFVLNYHF
jgi:hypothetical protein